MLIYQLIQVMQIIEEKLMIYIHFKDHLLGIR